MAATNIGMMDGAYFVGRVEILNWVNSILHLNLNKVEEVLTEILPSLPIEISIMSRRQGHHVSTDVG